MKSVSPHHLLVSMPRNCEYKVSLLLFFPNFSDSQLKILLFCVLAPGIRMKNLIHISNIALQVTHLFSLETFQISSYPWRDGISPRKYPNYFLLELFFFHLSYLTYLPDFFNIKKEPFLSLKKFSSTMSLIISCVSLPPFSVLES